MTLPLFLLTPAGVEAERSIRSVMAKAGKMKEIEKNFVNGAEFLAENGHAMGLEEVKNSGAYLFDYSV